MESSTQRHLDSNGDLENLPYTWKGPLLKKLRAIVTITWQSAESGLS